MVTSTQQMNKLTSINRNDEILSLRSGDISGWGEDNFKIMRPRLNQISDEYLLYPSVNALDGWQKWIFALNLKPSERRAHCSVHLSEATWSNRVGLLIQPRRIEWICLFFLAHSLPPIPKASLSLFWINFLAKQTKQFRSMAPYLLLRRVYHSSPNFFQFSIDF